MLEFGSRGDRIKQVGSLAALRQVIPASVPVKDLGRVTAPRPHRLPYPHHGTNSRLSRCIHADAWDEVTSSQVFPRGVQCTAHTRGSGLATPNSRSVTQITALRVIYAVA
jgi:hypothetical protein